MSDLSAAVANNLTDPRRCLVSLAAAALLLALGGCASQPTAASRWLEKPGTAPFERVLVVGVAKNADRRLSFEKSIAEDLRAGNTNAWASTRFMSSNDTLDEPTIMAIATEQEADAIIVTRVTRIDITPVEKGGRSTVLEEQQQSGFDHTYRRKPGTLFQYDYKEDVEATYLTSEYTTELHTDVYDTRTGRHVYELTSAVAKQESLDDVIRVLSDEIARRLKRDGVVR